MPGLAEPGSHVDDLARAALHHVRDHGLAAMEHAVHVDAKDVAKIRQ